MHMVVFCFATSHPASHTIALILVLKFGLSLCRVLRSFLNFRLLILFYLKKRNTRMKLFLNGDSNKRTLLDLNQALNYLSRVAQRRLLEICHVAVYIFAVVVKLVGWHR